jgi:hypothetical protein
MTYQSPFTGDPLMHGYYAVVALDLADRIREADAYRVANSGRPRTPGRVRRASAIVLASLSTAAASVARRLDSRVADDLAERLGPERLATNN